MQGQGFHIFCGLLQNVFCEAQFFTYAMQRQHCGHHVVAQNDTALSPDAHPLGHVFILVNRRTGMQPLRKAHQMPLRLSGDIGERTTESTVCFISLNMCFVAHCCNCASICRDHSSVGRIDNHGADGAGTDANA